VTVVERREIALVDLLDRLLAGGVVITGDITLRIADVDLVLSVVELLRRLMERQALRRFDDRMTELRERYGLRPEDLNLDLGPLGPLLPRE
jgi:hypothetical protein